MGGFGDAAHLPHRWRTSVQHRQGKMSIMRAGPRWCWLVITAPSSPHGDEGVVITVHYTTLHYIALRYITLHNVTLRYITLHYVTLPMREALGADEGRMREDEGGGGESPPSPSWVAHAAPSTRKQNKHNA